MLLRCLFIVLTLAALLATRSEAGSVYAPAPGAMVAAESTAIPQLPRPIPRLPAPPTPPVDDPAPPVEEPVVEEAPAEEPLVEEAPAEEPPPAPVELSPAPVMNGTLVAQTTHLDLYRLSGGLAEATILELAPQFETAIERVAERMQARLTGRVAIRFEPPQTGPCAIRGITYSHERRIQMFYAPDSDPQRVLAIVAHELAHQHQHDFYGWEAHQRSDIILLEGQATWASGMYSLDERGRPTWASAAEQALSEGWLLPLETNLVADCRTGTRNTAYIGWASFVDFLIITYGREAFDALYVTGRGRPAGSSAYLMIYGKDLATLDQEWRDWMWVNLYYLNHPKGE